MVGLSSNEDGVYLNTYNTGIGPAMVDDVVIHYQGKERHQDPFDFYVAERPGPGTAALSVDRMFRGRLIPAGQQVQMLGIGRSQTTDVQKHFMQELLGLIEVADVPRLWLSNSGLPLVSKDRAVVDITFSSVYGERWHVRSDEMVTTRR